MTRRVDDRQAPVTEVELRRRDDHACHRAAVVVGPHPVAELRVRVDLVGVPELAIAVVDQPVDRVDEWPVERMAHGERPRRQSACGGQASRVVDVGVRDEDGRHVDVESGERLCEDRIRRVRDSRVDDRGGSPADDEEDAHVPVTERRDEPVHAGDDLAHNPYRSARSGSSGEGGARVAVQAPSTAIDCPLTYDACSESRKATTAATSAGSPTLRSGGNDSRVRSAASGSGLCSMPRSRSGVRMPPGAIALTRTPIGPYSTARLLVNASMPPLEVSYAAWFATPRRPWTDEMLTIAPPLRCSTKAAAAAPHPHIVPPRFTSRTRRIASTSGR